MNVQLPATTALAALSAPLIRLWRLTEQERAVSVLAGIFGFLWDPVFHVGLGLLLFFNAWDWLLGVRLASWRREYDGAIAFNGALSKLTALVLVVGLRTLEAWAPAAGIAPGAVAAGLIANGALAGLIVVEMKSVGEKYVALGGGSLAPLFGALDRLLGARRGGE